MTTIIRMIWYIALIVEGVAAFEWYRVIRKETKGYKEFEKISFWTIVLICASFIMMVTLYLLK